MEASKKYFNPIVIRSINLKDSFKIKNMQTFPILTSFSFIIEQCAILKNIYLQKAKLTLKVISNFESCFTIGEGSNN